MNKVKLNTGGYGVMDNGKVIFKGPRKACAVYKKPKAKKPIEKSIESKIRPLSTQQ